MYDILYNTKFAWVTYFSEVSVIYSYHVISRYSKGHFEDLELWSAVSSASGHNHSMLRFGIDTTNFLTKPQIHQRLLLLDVIDSLH